MKLLATLLILSTAAAPAIETRPPEAAELFRAGFEADEDRDFDSWPDGWTRQRGPGFPHYVRIELACQSCPDGEQCLVIEMDGGAAALFSPPVPIDGNFACLLEGMLRAEGLRYDTAYFSLTLLDAEQNVLARETSTPQTGTTEWTLARVGPLSATRGQPKFAVAGMHVTPGERADLRGSAMFDRVWMGSTPRLTIESSAPGGFYNVPQDVELTCGVWSAGGLQVRLRTDLHDCAGQLIDSREDALDDPQAAVDALAEAGASAEHSFRWRPAGLDYGYYLARATLLGPGGELTSRELPLVVAKPATAVEGGEFGWTLPDGDARIPLTQLAEIVARGGVDWVKFPIWPSRDTSTADLAHFIERLGQDGIQTVGLLQPPAAETHTSDGARLNAANIFLPDDNSWHTALEPVLAGMSLNVREWQLGEDRDASFVGYQDLPERLEVVRTRLARLIPGLKLGIGWDWSHDLPAAKKLPWQFVNLPAAPTMDAEGLVIALKGGNPGSLARWVAIEPLPREDALPEIRARDLVRRMVAAKTGGADRIFVPDPFDAERGLLTSGGAPAELLIPWRTTALALSGAQWLGRLQLPGGSANEVFASGDEAVLVLWNETPRRDELHVAANLTQTDVWGRQLAITRTADAQSMHIAPTPSFVRGWHAGAAKMAIGMQLERPQLPSELGRPHENAVTLRNGFSQSGAGRVRVIAPEGWIVHPAEFEFGLAPGEELRQPLELTFPFDANSGRHRLRFDIEWSSDATHRLSVFRALDVGLGDVLLEAVTRLDEEGRLLVEQRITNNTDLPVSFRCDLSAPGRRLLRTQVAGLLRGTDVQTYTLPKGRKLAGQTIWVRAAEIQGARVLSQRLVVEE